MFMVDSVDIKVDGIDEIVSKLNLISEDLRYKGGRFALRKAAQVIEKKIEENADKIDDPNTENKISSNVAVRWSNKSFRKNGDLTFRVGVLGGAKVIKNPRGLSKSVPGGDTFYWRFLEFGTENARAIPFFRPAIESSKSQALDTFVKEYNKAIDRAIKKSSK